MSYNIFPGHLIFVDLQIPAIFKCAGLFVVIIPIMQLQIYLQ